MFYRRQKTGMLVNIVRCPRQHSRQRINYLSQNINTSKLEKPCCRKVKSYLKEDTFKFTIEKYVGFQKVEPGWVYYQKQVISVRKNQ